MKDWIKRWVNKFKEMLEKKKTQADATPDVLYATSPA